MDIFTPLNKIFHFFPLNNFAILKTGVLKKVNEISAKNFNFNFLQKIKII